jgi:hypothetical protein
MAFFSSPISIVWGVLYIMASYLLIVRCCRLGITVIVLNLWLEDWFCIGCNDMTTNLIDMYEPIAIVAIIRSLPPPGLMFCKHY